MLLSEAGVQVQVSEQCWTVSGSACNGVRSSEETGQAGLVRQGRRLVRKSDMSPQFLSFPLTGLMLLQLHY